MSMKLIMERWRMHAKTQNVIVESEKHSSIEDFEIDDVIQKTEIWQNALQLGRLLARRNPDKNMAGNCKNFKDVENQHIEAKIFRSAIGCPSKDPIGMNEVRCVKCSKKRRLNLKIERKK